MCRLILTIAAVVAIAQLSLQASLPNDEHFKYSFKNLGPDDTQKLDMVEFFESNSETRNLPVTTLNVPNLAFVNWPNYAIGLVNLTITNYVDSEICLLHNQSFCCRFQIYWQQLITNINSLHYFYRFGIFQASDNVTALPTVCSVFRCATENLQDCDRVINVNTNVVFQNMTITANITRQHEYLLEPNSFNANLVPFGASEYEWHEFEENDFYGVQYILNTTATNVYAFSINGTGNGTNIDDGGDDGAAALAVSMFIMFSIFLVTVIA